MATGWVRFWVLTSLMATWKELSGAADHDHIATVLPALENCPNATVVASSQIVIRLVGNISFPPQPTRWVNAVESMTLADRTLQFVRPPLCDSPTTRAIFDTTGRARILSASDSRPSFSP